MGMKSYSNKKPQHCKHTNKNYSYQQNQKMKKKNQNGMQKWMTGMKSSENIIKSIELTIETYK